MGLELETAPGVLVPRDETELLGQTALKLLGEGAAAEARVIDMCCGSGNLACGLAHAAPALRVWASDLTDECVSLTRRNVDRLRLGSRVTVVKGDLFDSLTSLEGTIDLIVCNPPYISSGRLAGASAHLLESEPREAFDGGPYGISIQQRVIAAATRFLKPEAWLVFEIGLGQERQVTRLFERAGKYHDLRSFQDSTGAPRVVAARAMG